MNDKMTEEAARKSLRAIARKNGVRVDAVKREIEMAIAVAKNNQDPEIQAFWKRVPCKQDTPTPEEVITYITEMARGNKH